MAEQEEPVRRRVAVKVIKLGMDTKQVIARFEAERQALALMDHPNIAKVFDAGSTERPLTPGSAGILPASSALLTHEQPAGEDAGAPRQAYGQGPGERDVARLQIENQKSQITPGRPYFVMELVRGIRITDYCLGVVHAHREQWSAAIPNFAKVVEFIPTDHQAYHALAPLLLQNGDREAYQRLRERILGQFGQTSNPVVAERMAK